ncbi:MAG: hypothetical protein KIT10_07990 [Flavobacteriales bacterium]|nr:hypothetical protein [Flavobacteriales bacterium]
MRFEDLHTEHVEWFSTLDFAKSEMGILEQRLEQIAQRNNKPEVMAQVEHFQNQFIRQREVIDELRHAVNEHEQFLQKEATERPETITHRRFGDHAVLREQMTTFSKLLGELRAEFQGWATQWM